MTVPTIRMPYLITSREWPQDPQLLSQELTKAYTEIALAVNRRTIGIYDRFEIVTGNEWYNVTTPSNRRQSYRKVYLFNNYAPGPYTIDHGLRNLEQIVDYYGAATTSTDYRKLPYTAITASDQVEIKVTNTQIEITVGATSPTLTSGFIVLEYILTSR